MADELRDLFHKALHTRSDDRCCEWIIRMQHHDPAAVIAFLSDISSGNASRPRYVAAWVLGELGFPKRPFLQRRFDLLDRLLKTARDDRLKARAILSLGHLNLTAAWKRVSPYARHTAPPVRLAAIQALGAWTGPTAFAILRRALRDASPPVIEWSLFGLASFRFRKFRSRLLPAIQPFLNQPTRNIRIEALRTWTEHEGHNYGKLLCEALDQDGADRRLVQCVQIIDARRRGDW